MTRQRSLRSRVRSRIGKTGESYTTARRNLLPQIEYASAPESIKGQVGSDDALLDRTGRGWADGSTRIAVTFTPKSEVKAQVAVNHEKITDADTAAHLKTYWRERLAALKQLLES